MNSHMLTTKVVILQEFLPKRKLMMLSPPINKIAVGVKSYVPQYLNVQLICM